MVLVFSATGFLCVVLVALWDRHHEDTRKRNHTRWLASFYEAPSGKEPRR